MKITKLDIYILRAPDTGRPHWVSNFIVPRANEILVRMHTDEGVDGIGIATSYTPIEAAIKAFRSGITDLVVGAAFVRRSRAALDLVLPVHLRNVDGAS
jgi:L-alanine-DL-glutamate epimerase-like enolase superfamily enzyme